MGWAFATNQEGRQVGYGVEAECDHDGCDAQIDRGLASVCGEMHDGGEHGCGRYFCGKHLALYFHDGDPDADTSKGRRGEDGSPFLCDSCGAEFEQDETADVSEVGNVKRPAE